MSGIFDRDLDRNAANSTPLTPLSFLPWAAHVYPEKTAVIHGERTYTYAEFQARCRRLAYWHFNVASFLPAPAYLIKLPFRQAAGSTLYV